MLHYSLNLSAVTAMDHYFLKEVVSPKAAGFPLHISESFPLHIILQKEISP